MRYKCKHCKVWLEWNGSNMYCPSCGEIDNDLGSIDYGDYYYIDYEKMEVE